LTDGRWSAAAALIRTALFSCWAGVPQTPQRTAGAGAADGGRFGPPCLGTWWPESQAEQENRGVSGRAARGGTWPHEGNKCSKQASGGLTRSPVETDGDPCPMEWSLDMSLPVSPSASSAAAVLVCCGHCARFYFPAPSSRTTGHVRDGNLTVVTARTMTARWSGLTRQFLQLRLIGPAAGAFVDLGQTASAMTAPEPGWWR
jgi:hypothetical protein